MPRDGAECAWIGEADAPPAVEIEGDARMPGKQGRGAPDVPVPIEPEVDQQDGTVVEQEELMLPTAPHVDDAPPADVAHDRRREGPSLRPVMHADVVDATAPDRASQSADGELDLREFRQMRPAMRGEPD